MGKIIAIALNTFRESIRDKVFYSLLAFAVLMLGFSIILAHLTIGDPLKIIKDFGLGMISLFGTLIAIFVGIGLVYKEMEKRTIYVILTKPIARWQFLLGKYMGLSLTLMVEVIIMTIGLFLLCYYNRPWFVPEGTIPWELFYAIIPIIIELYLILAVALFFSSFSSPFLSALFTLGIFVIGHASYDLKILAKKTEDIFLQKVCNFLYYVLPNLENFNFKTRVVHNLPLSLQEVAFSVIYGLLYILITLLVTMVIFQRKDIK